MKPSSSEKLILMMLCEIYKKLGIKDDIDPDFVTSAIIRLWCKSSGLLSVVLSNGLQEARWRGF